MDIYVKELYNQKVLRYLVLPHYAVPRDYLIRTLVTLFIALLKIINYNHCRFRRMFCLLLKCSSSGTLLDCHLSPMDGRKKGRTSSPTSHYLNFAFFLFFHTIFNTLLQLLHVIRSGGLQNC